MIYDTTRLLVVVGWCRGSTRGLLTVAGGGGDATSFDESRSQRKS